MFFQRSNRRRTSGADVAIVEGPLSTASTNTVTFASIPADGKLIVICHHVSGSGTATTATGPAGFSTAVSINQGGARPAAIFWKVASGEASATYTVTNTAAVGQNRVMGYVLSGQHATPIGTSGSKADNTTGTSLDAAATAINIAAGSLVIGTHSANGSMAGATYSNSFSAAVVSASGFVASAYRAYPSSATSQNTTNTWTTTQTQRRALLVEIVKA